MSIAYLRHNLGKKIDCYLKATTTMILGATTTHFYSSAFDCTGYNSGVFLLRTVANASADPGVYLEGRVDTTTYATIANIDTDITTTANNVAVAVRGLPNFCRIRVTKNGTTTSHFRLTVKAVLKVV